MVTKERWYIAYDRNDFPIVIGISIELAKYFNVSIESIKWKSTPSAHKRHEASSYRVYKVE